MPLQSDIPFDVYRSWPGVHSGLLNEIARSPAHGRQFEYDGGGKDTPAKKFGRKTHFACLQPDIYRARVALTPLGPQTKTFSALEDAYPQSIFVTEDQAEQIDGMCASIWSHPEARRILSAPGMIETSAEWTDAETGLECKARFDKVVDSRELADLKTTKCAQSWAFTRDVVAYGDHRQAAWYRRGYREATGWNGPLPFWFIAVEKTPPYAVAVYQLSEDELDIIDRENTKLLQTWAECKRTGIYPAYCDTWRLLALPEYALRSGDETPIMFGDEVMDL
jgi:hypothetical protein